MSVQSVEKISDTCETVTMAPVCGAYGPNGESEDNTYARWTPSGSLSLTITNPNLVGKFSKDQVFYVDFTPRDTCNG